MSIIKILCKILSETLLGINKINLNQNTLYNNVNNNTNNQMMATVIYNTDNNITSSINNEMNDRIENNNIAHDTLNEPVSNTQIKQLRTK
ncbi:MAG: hypothetical protein IJU54_01735 [Alphaproteobacteria bacterium]|nr:hypothetical protein [Alphaproteobacteria bacterium]